MKKKLDKLAATFLALLLLLLPAVLSARERRGANLVITLKDGQSVTGELIAVKPDSLLLLLPAGKDESISIADIATIDIYKKRKPIRGVLYGTLIGAVGAGLVGYVVAPKGHDEYPGIVAMIFATGGVVLGGAIGLATQLGQERGKEIVIAGQPEEVVKSALANLRGKARIRDYK